jgi:single-strand DNA-binding protein
MADLNTLSLTGRLTRDPDLRSTPAGDDVCNFRIAVNGVRDDDVVFVDVDVWGRSAPACGQYLSKGSRVAVAGRLGVRDWQSNEGESRRSVECNNARVSFLETKAESQQHAQAAPVPPQQPPQMQQPPPPQQQMQPQQQRVPDDDDIPF